MAVLDEAALICDFAETYHIYDWRSLPARYAAILASGLRPDSRIMLKISDTAVPINTMLLATIADATRVQAWHETKDGQRGRNAPKSLLELITKKIGDRVEPGRGFDSAADFVKWRENMLGGE